MIEAKAFIRVVRNFISVINDMFFMFVDVGKVADLLLPFVTCMIWKNICFRIILALDEVIVEVIILMFAGAFESYFCSF